mmetsp:Transcript_95317/g.308796  ORF Transcript_95317/g.308796 Transcript_95317/m.308796 type:complete len:203 (-) Transcript_95317:4274-4882(-)
MERLQSGSAAPRHSARSREPPIPQRRKTPTNSLHGNLWSSPACTSASCKITPACEAPAESISSRKRSNSSLGNMLSACAAAAVPACSGSGGQASRATAARPPPRPEGATSAPCAAPAEAATTAASRPPTGPKRRLRRTASTQARNDDKAPNTSAAASSRRPGAPSQRRSASVATLATCDASFRQVDHTATGSGGCAASRRAS